MTDRDDRNLRAFLAHDGEGMLVTAIGLALHVACGILAERHARALITLAADHVLCARAGKLILRYLLRAMVDRVEPTSKQFDALVQDIIALTKES